MNRKCLMATATKGNSGKSAGMRSWRRFLPCIALVPIVIVIALRKQKKSSFTTDFATTVTWSSHKDIIESHLTLIDLVVPSGSLQRRTQNSNRYGDLQAAFCAIDWDRQSADPSKTPMFRDLKNGSFKCRATKTIVTDFYSLVQEAKVFDGFDDVNGIHGGDNNGNVFPPNGVVFHETRCGSTLLSNMMAGFAPGRSRVYSESPPPLKALSACSAGYGSHCDQDLHRELIRDVFYMMGRRAPLKNKNEANYLFFKMQSFNTWNMDTFAMTFPEVPWVYSYRDTVEIMQSHMKEATTPSRVCTKLRYLPLDQQPSQTMQIIKEAGKSLANMSLIEYCAAHLAGMSLKAVNTYDQIKSNSANSDLPGGRFVNYNQLPAIFWEEILPHHFGVNPLPPNSVTNIQKVTESYSKGRGRSAGKEWSEDTTMKQQTASLDVTEAANLFASKVYNRMKELSSL